MRPAKKALKKYLITANTLLKRAANTISFEASNGQTVLIKLNDNNFCYILDGKSIDLWSLIEFSPTFESVEKYFLNKKMGPPARIKKWLVNLIHLMHAEGIMYLRKQG